MCDDDATSELRVKTVRYFKGIQETQEALLHRPMEGYSGHALKSGHHSPSFGPTAQMPSSVFAAIGAKAGGGHNHGAGSGVVVDVTAAKPAENGK